MGKHRNKTSKRKKKIKPLCAISNYRCQLNICSLYRDVLGDKAKSLKYDRYREECERCTNHGNCGAEQRINNNYGSWLQPLLASLLRMQLKIEDSTLKDLSNEYKYIRFIKYDIKQDHGFTTSKKLHGVKVLGRKSNQTAFCKGAKQDGFDNKVR